MGHEQVGIYSEILRKHVPHQNYIQVLIISSKYIEQQSLD